MDTKYPGEIRRSGNKYTGIAKHFAWRLKSLEAGRLSERPGFMVFFYLSLLAFQLSSFQAFPITGLLTSFVKNSREALISKESTIIVEKLRN